MAWTSIFKRSRISQAFGGTFKTWWPARISSLGSTASDTVNWWEKEVHLGERGKTLKFGLRLLQFEESTKAPVNVWKARRECGPGAPSSVLSTYLVLWATRTATSCCSWLSGFDSLRAEIWSYWFFRHTPLHSNPRTQRGPCTVHRQESVVGKRSSFRVKLSIGRGDSGVQLCDSCPWGVPELTWEAKYTDVLTKAAESVRAQWGV